MFGYVKPYKPHLRICEYEAYKAVYCSLCRTIKRNYGLAASMTLSYDFAFLSLLQCSFSENSPELHKCFCFANPFIKRLCFTDINFDFIAGAALILIYNKINDDIADAGFLKGMKKRISRLFLKNSFKKASHSYPHIADVVSEQMKKQSNLEKENCKTIDRASEPTAVMLSVIASCISDRPEQKAILKRFGYLLGRYIYIVDAYDDIERDFKNNSFNPLVIGNSAVNDLDMTEINKRVSDSINFTLGALSDSYVLLDIKQFKPILDNIVYVGLKNVFYEIQNRKGDKDNESK